MYDNKWYDQKKGRAAFAAGEKAASTKLASICFSGAGDHICYYLSLCAHLWRSVGLSGFRSRSWHYRQPLGGIKIFSTLFLLTAVWINLYKHHHIEPLQSDRRLPRTDYFGASIKLHAKYALTSLRTNGDLCKQ